MIQNHYHHAIVELLLVIILQFVISFLQSQDLIVFKMARFDSKFVVTERVTCFLYNPNEYRNEREVYKKRFTKD